MKRGFKTITGLLLMLVISACSLTAQQTGSTPPAASTKAPAASVAQPASATAIPSATTPLPTRPVPTLAVQDISGLPRLADLPEGWSKIDPGGKTTCARGGTYSFSVRKTNSNKLLIYFEGGGTCYDAATCRQGGGVFDDSIDYEFVADNPALKSDGVFAFSNPLNPFKDYNVIFINYCTGDAYLGAKTTDYTYDGYTYSVQHMGFENARTVMEWTYQNFEKPESLFMIGCSAGVIGSYMQSPYILEHYKGVPTVLIGDSGGPYIDGPAALFSNFGVENLFASWIPSYEQLISGGIVHSSMFLTIPAQTYPAVKFGLLDTTGDAVQAKLLSSFQPDLSLSASIDANLNKVRADAPDFLSYTGPGDYHCITMNPAFYGYSVNNVRLDDWFARLAAGQTVEKVSP